MHTAKLNLLHLPPAARAAHIFPALGNALLISIRQLCNANCTATFTADTVTVTHNGNTIICGTCTNATNLWTATLQQDDPITHKPKQHTPQPQANNVNHTRKTAELVAFAHGTLFSPAIITLRQALWRNYIHNFPGLTEKSLRQHPPLSVATIKGHLDQSRQNQRSTKPKVTFPEDISPPPDDPLSPTEDTLNTELSTDFWPSSDPDNERTHQCFTACTEDTLTGKIFTDQTGCFIIPSSTGNTQIFILYDYDSNSIHAEQLKNCTATEIL